MRRFWMVGMGGAALLAGWLLTDVARAGDEAKQEVRRPGKRVEVVRMARGRRPPRGFPGGGRRATTSTRLGLSAERGAVVTDVQEGSAAEKAGVKDGDVIVRFGGQDVWSAAQLARLVRETPAGRTVDLEVSRGGSIQKLSVTLVKPDRDHMFARGPGGMGEDFHFEMPDFPRCRTFRAGRPRRAPRATHPACLPPLRPGPGPQAGPLVPGAGRPARAVLQGRGRGAGHRRRRRRAGREGGDQGRRRHRPRGREGREGRRGPPRGPPGRRRRTATRRSACSARAGSMDLTVKMAR